MSTFLYLRCENHDPPLQSQDESGQHLYDLPQIRADLAARDDLVRLHGDRMRSVDLGYFRNRTLDFLVAHPRCRLTIVDEYGTEHPATAGADE